MNPRFEDLPRPGIWKKLLLGLLPGRVRHRRRHVGGRLPRGGHRGRHAQAERGHPPGHGPAGRGRPGQAADDPAAGLGPPARRRQGRRRRHRRALGHDHPGPAGPGPQGHRADEPAARPARPDPRPRHGQDQRGVRARRPGADPAHGQGADRPADQPRGQRRLQGLRGSGQRDRLHLRGRGPALLQRHRRVRLHQRALRLPAPVRAAGARVRALPPRGHRPGARRAPAGGHPRHQAAGGRDRPDREPRASSRRSSASTRPRTRR